MCEGRSVIYTRGTCVSWWQDTGHEALVASYELWTVFEGLGCEERHRGLYNILSGKIIRSVERSWGLHPLGAVFCSLEKIH